MAETHRCSHCFYVPEGTGPEQLAENIRRLRLLRGYTQGDLACLAGLSKRTISLIETRKVVAKPETISEIAFALDTTPDHLWESSH